MDALVGIGLGLFWMFALYEGVVHHFDHLFGFFRWLQGSRTSFYLRPSDRSLEFQSLNMRGTTQYPIIELSRGPFRRHSALYGRNSENWKITVGHWYKNSIELQDGKGLPVQTALELVNTHSSLQAMLDRISELEKDLDTSRCAEGRWLSALDAIRKDINLSRQRFRSEAAQEICENIEAVLKDGGSPLPSDFAVESWRHIFKSLREQREMAKEMAPSSRK